MTHTHRNPFGLRFKPKWIIITILVIGLVYVVLFGLRIDWFIPQQFASAKTAWDAKHIQHYKVTVVVAGFCAPPCGVEMSIEVRDNQVIAVEERPALLVGRYDEPPYTALASEKWDKYGVQEYTVDAMFGRVAERIAGVPTIYVTSGGGTNFYLSYDSEHGYVKSFTESVCGQGGLMYAASDCIWGFTIRDFQVLP